MRRRYNPGLTSSVTSRGICGGFRILGTSMRSSFALAALLAALVATPASAALVTYTYSGFVSSGFDGTGVFGTANASLGGLAFTAVFQRDEGVTPVDSFQGGTVSFVEGPGVLTASLEINGVTQAFGLGPGGFGRQFQFDDPTFEQFTHRVTDGVSEDLGDAVRNYSASLELGAFGVGTDYLGGPDYRTLGDEAAQFDFFFGGNFSIFEEIAPDVGSTTIAKNALGVLIPTSLKVAVVPEPQTWALLILGFGLTGAALRGRRPRTQPAL
jgi:hypothetical protein